MEEHQGSILVFVSGIADIRFLAEKLAEYVPKHFLLCPLYGDLTLTQQQQETLSSCRPISNRFLK